MQKFYSLQYLTKFAENAFIFHRFETNDTAYSYKDIIQAVEYLLIKFREHNLPESVGIALKLYQGHSPGSCALLLCILNHNCHFCPMEPDLPEHIFAARLYDSGSKFLITDKKLVNAQLPNNESVLQLNVLGEVFYFISVLDSKTLIKKQNFCYTIGTSGSTGMPKVIHVPYECIAPNVEALSSLLQLSSTDVIFLCAPLTFDPFVIEFFLALTSGAALVITSASLRMVSQKLLYKLFPERDSSIQHGGGVTILQMTPSLFRLFGVDAIRNVILNKQSSLRVLLLGGEVFPAIDELCSWMPNDFSIPFDGKHIFNIYGITELSCWSLINDCILSPSERKKCIPLGKSIDAETQVRIVNNEGEILYGAVKQGELQLGSTTRKCYIPQIDELNVSANTMLFRSTGDLVERDEKGDIYYIGRLNNTIKRFGKRVCLDSVAKKMEGILEAKEVQVICLWHAHSQKLISCITTANNRSLNVHECSTLLKQHLTNYEKPNKILFLKSFPLNSHGKVDRNLLTKSINNSDQHRTPTDILKSFLSEVLAINFSHDNEHTNDSPPKKRQVSSLNLSFMASGGTSFQALSLFSEIGECLDHGAHSQKFLEMLFNPNSTLANLIEFLNLFEFKLKNTLDANNYSTLNLNHKSKRFRLLWRVNMHKCIDAAATNILNRYICIGSHSHILLTLEAGTGDEICRLELPDRIECKVELIDSLQLGLVGCYDGSLYAFDYLSGKICWQLNAGGMIKAKPLVCNEKVIIASYAEDFNLLCVCLKTQALLWRCKIGNKGMFSTPFLLDACSLLICTLDGSYARINITTGKAMWTEKCNSPIFSTPAFICCNELEFIVIAEVNGKLHICKMENGEILHTFEAAGNIFSSITTASVIHSDDSNTVLIYFGCHDRHVYCLKFTFIVKGMKETYTTLEQLWKTCLNSTIFATPVLLHMQKTTYIVACSTKGLLTLLSAEAGDIIAAYDLECEVFSTPCCIETDKIYLGCRDNFVYCFKVV